MHSPDTPAGLRRVEAARYALLRRLTMAMRHHMVVHLQPIGLITQVIERRLRSEAPDVGRIGEDMVKVHGFARAAVDANLDVVSWLSPDPEQRVTLDAGVQECVDLLRTHFSFRGFDVAHLPGGGDALLPRAAIRTLLPAALFRVTDGRAGGAEVLLRTHDSAAGPVLDLELVPRAAQPGAESPQPPYRVLGWDDVEALAAVEGATFTRTAGGARLQFLGGR